MSGAISPPYAFMTCKGTTCKLFYWTFHVCLLQIQNDCYGGNVATWIMFYGIKYFAFIC